MRERALSTPRPPGSVPTSLLAIADEGSSSLLQILRAVYGTSRLNSAMQQYRASVAPHLPTSVLYQNFLGALSSP
jgi:hypothetical protein